MPPSLSRPMRMLSTATGVEKSLSTIITLRRTVSFASVDLGLSPDIEECFGAVWSALVVLRL